MSAWEEYKALAAQAKAREEEAMQRHIDRTEGQSYPETHSEQGLPQHKRAVDTQGLYVAYKQVVDHNRPHPAHYAWSAHAEALFEARFMAYLVWKKAFDQEVRAYLSDTNTPTLTPQRVERDLQGCETKAWGRTRGMDPLEALSRGPAPPRLESWATQHAREDARMLADMERTIGHKEERVAAAWARLDAGLDREIPRRPPQTHTQEHAHERGA